MVTRERSGAVTIAVAVERLSGKRRSLRRQQTMELLRSPVDATGGNRSQTPRRPTRRKQAKTLAVGCHWLREEAHGKEGVDGSSPSEGLKYLQISYFCCLFRRIAGDHYGGGQRGGDLQGFGISADARADFWGKREPCENTGFASAETTSASALTRERPGVVPPEGPAQAGRMTPRSRATR
jgi:hypothetical protein